MVPIQHFSLTPLNTLRLPAQAAQYVRLSALTDLPQLPAHTRRLILGGGSNLVLAGNFAGLVLHVALSGKRLRGEDADAWYVEAASGENWHEFVLWTLAQGWPGLENLALIPGLVGAAPIQNIGAYGREAGELIEQLTAYDFERQQEVTFSAADCHFAYRNSVFKENDWHRRGRFLITAVVFRLPKHWQSRLGYADMRRELADRQLESPTPTQVAEAVIAIRREKLPDPDIVPNAGSFFENPVVDAAIAATLLKQHPKLPHHPQADGKVKLAAGWLIEQAGWKGRSLGPVGMYEKQALVLINHGGASGSDVLRLVAAVQADVRQQFGIDLRPEPVFLA